MTRRPNNSPLSRVRENELDEPIEVSISGIPTSAPTQAQPRSIGGRYNWLTIIVYIGFFTILCGAALFFGYRGYQALNSNQQSTAISTPNAQPTSSGVLPSFLTTPTATPYVFDNPAGEKETVTVCVLGGFGTYEMWILSQYMQNLPVNINILPLDFYDPATGVRITRGNELEQPDMVRDGTCDLLMTTHDFLAKYPSIGAKFIGVVDRSHGVDFISAYYEGVTEGCRKKINIFNDVVGCRIAVAGGSVSEYLLLSALYSAKINVADVHIDRYETAELAELAFVEGKDDFVVSWIQDGNQTIIEGVSRVILDTEYFTNVYDVILVSPKADAEKKDAIIGALYAYFASIKMYVENPADSAQKIADWVYVDDQGVSHATNDWSYVGVTDDPLADMQALLDGVAPASFDNNMYYPDHPKVWQNMVTTARQYWEYSGQLMETPFDPAALTDTSYLAALSGHTELRPVPGATFDDKTFSPEPLPQAPPTAEQLIELPTLVELRCDAEKVFFQPGESTINPDSEQGKAFANCAENIGQLALQTDMQFLVIGAAGQPDPKCYPRNPPYSYEYSVDLATARAEWLMGQLSNYGVPKDRMASTIEVGPVACYESGLKDWRFGHVEAKPLQGGG